MNAVPEGGFWLAWVRGPAELQAGWISLRAARQEPYCLVGEESPWPSHPTLPYQSRQRLAFDLADATDRTKRDRFVATYGLLTKGPGLPPAELREPLPLWENEALSIRNLLYLHEAIRSAAEGTAEGKTRLQSLRDWAMDAVRGADYDLAMEWPAKVFPQWRETDVVDDRDIRAANWALATILASRLHQLGVMYQPMPTSSTRIARAAVGGTLLAHAYVAAEALIVGRVPLGVCADPTCGRLFERSDPRKLYHAQECSNRVRQRRAREEERKHGKKKGSR